MDHNISIHTYNDWKHQLKLECLDSLLPSGHDIVPLTAPIDTPSATEFLSTADLLSNSRELQGYHSIYLSCGDIQITASPSVSEERLLALLKAVRHALQHRGNSKDQRSQYLSVSGAASHGTAWAR